MYNLQMEEINEEEQKGISFVIRPPDALGISRAANDPTELERIYQVGRREASRTLPLLICFLSES